MTEDSLKNLVESTGGRSESSIERLVIVGGGTMGQGIAQLSARKGVEVLLIEREEDSLSRTLKDIDDLLSREIEKWALTESEKKAILSRIKGSVGFTQISDQQFIIEAIPERLDHKEELFKLLDKVCSPEAIFITNTSTLSITELASTVSKPERVIGMHFISPVHKVKVIELVRGLKTSTETFCKALLLAEKLERTAIEVYESPGYVTTRVMMPLVNEAIQVLMEGVASAHDIDTAMRLGYELPHGPLAMADHMGLDVVLTWLEVLFRDLGDVKYKPCALLRMMVRAGHLGVKNGQGFFKYDDEGRQIPHSGHIMSAFQRSMKEQEKAF
ncbi:MAG: 3-hydroxybutyryl-CoA dehydrogenase [Calditrichaeota bacterium]|nr:3-hydroxybutyryl-CoA dehydrogenase [Calditrichota bacterium]